MESQPTPPDNTPGQQQQPQLGPGVRRVSARARAACQVCRWKKVRCDARDGKPCSNCVFDDVQCLLLPKRPRKKSAAVKATRLMARLDPRADSNAEMPQPPLTQTTVSSTSQSQAIPLGPVTASETVSPGLWTVTNFGQATFPPPSVGHSSQRSALSVVSDSPDLPAYIRPLPASMCADDINYLRRKGALIIPDPQLRDQCLMGYFRNIHPLHPLVDFVKIQSIINGTNGDGEKLSLLLLQALIFAGCTWADVRLIRSLGFLTRKAFRQDMHQKIRLLYNVDYEDDRFCLVQSLVLWSFWWKGTNENKDPWHYLGVAHSIARTIDLHKPCSDANVSPSMKRLRRRVWWALVNRDAIASFGLSRAPKDRGNDSDMPMLGLEDFDLIDTSSETSSPAIRQSAVRSHFLARVCIEHTKFVRIFCRILGEACPEGDAGRTPALFTTQQLEGLHDVPLRGQLNVEYLKACENELRKWRQELPEDLWHNGPLPTSLSEWDKSEFAVKGYLSMMFYTALMTLHRPQMLPSTSENPSEDSSRATVRQSATDITKIGMDFYNADIVSSLSPTCISSLIPSSINHVFDMFSGLPSIRAEASQRLEQYRAVVHGFSEQHFAACWVLRTIDHILNRARQQNQSTSCGNTEGIIVSRPAEDGRDLAASPINPGLLSWGTADGSISQISTDSLADMPIANLPGKSAGLPTYLLSPPEQSWSWFPSSETDGLASGQQSYILSGRGFSEEMANAAALEDMWSDFIRVSDMSAGPIQTDSHF